jgi:hypothetical protein
MLRRRLRLRTLLKKKRISLASIWCRKNPTVKTKGITILPLTSLQWLIPSTTGRRRTKSKIYLTKFVTLVLFIFASCVIFEVRYPEALIVQQILTTPSLRFHEIIVIIAMNNTIFKNKHDDCVSSDWESKNLKHRRKDHRWSNLDI